MAINRDLVYENGIIKMPDLNYTPDPRGVGCLFFDTMSQNQNKIAQIYAPTDEEDTYGSLLERCIQTATVMRKCYDITPNDIVSICTINHLNSCVPFISTLFLGATVSSFDPTLSQTEMCYLVKMVRPKLVFVSAEGLERIELAIKETGSNTKIVFFGETTHYIPFIKFLKGVGEENSFVPYAIEDNKKNAVILFSSGTTSSPKGLCLSHFSYMGQIKSWCSSDYFSRVLSFTTLYWISAIVLIGDAIVKGTIRVIMPKFDPEEVWKTVQKHKVNLVFVSPYQSIFLNNTKLPPNFDTKNLKSIIIAGGSLSEKKLTDIRQLLPSVEISLLYGLSEIGCATRFECSIDQHVKFSKEKLTSSGMGLNGFAYKIVAPETDKVLGPNQQGELRIKSDYLISGYYQTDSLSIWDSEGWFRSGDIAYYDTDLCFYIAGRLKEVLKFRGFHILPATIENVLYAHPGIKYAAVVGIPHEEDGDHPCAAVVLKPSHANVSKEELINYVVEKIDDRHKLRGGIIVTDELPLLVTGKIDKKAVKAMLFK